MPCKPALCLNCGHDLSRPSMQSGVMTCSYCGCCFYAESLARWAHALAGSRRALTMAEKQIRSLPGDLTGSECETLAAIKAARTLMLKAEGRSE